MAVIPMSEAADATDSRYQLVDSLYGPGTVGGWLLTLGAILVTWTLNRKARRHDTISLDLVAGLLLPLIAAGHIFFLVVRLPVSVAEAITSQDVTMQQYASAIEAPLNICETFSITALALAICCGPWWKSNAKVKRLGAVVLVGLLCWATENMMFAMATMKGVKVEDVNLSRPYLFIVTPIVASTWGFLGITAILGGSIWTLAQFRMRGARNNRQDQPPSLSVVYQNKPSRPKTRNGDPTANRQYILDELETHHRQFEGDRETNRSMMYMTFVAVLFLPLSALFMIVNVFKNQAPSQAPTAWPPSGARPKHILFIPQSTSTMQSLDQIVALTSGALGLLVAIRRAYRYRTFEEERSHTPIKRRRSI